MDISKLKPYQIWYNNRLVWQGYAAPLSGSFSYYTKEAGYTVYTGKPFVISERREGIQN